MKLAIIPEGPLAFDGENYYFTEGGGYYIDQIARHFESVVVICHAFKKGEPYYESMTAYRFKSDNISFVEMPLKYGLPGKILQLFLCFKVIASIFGKVDAFYLFMPGYPAAIASLLCRLRRKPYLLYLAADWEESADILFPLKRVNFKFLKSSFRRLIGWLQDQAVRSSRATLTAGSFMKNKYLSFGVPVYETIPRLNWPAFKIYSREDTCKGKDIQLIFVGYLLKRKGADLFIDCIKMLREQGYAVKGIVIGDGEQAPFLKHKVEDGDLQQYVEMKGHLDNGEPLIQQYRESDIFVFPTLGGEGFPRVLYEALSQSLPIVTSDVCGIAEKLPPEELALFAPAGNVDEFVSRIESLINSESLRKKLISNGQVFMNNLIHGSDGGLQVYELCDQYISLDTIKLN